MRKEVLSVIDPTELAGGKPSVLSFREMWAEMPSAASELLHRLDEHHPPTLRHSWRVAVLAGLLACEFGLSSDIQEDIVQAVFLHDVGKIVVPPGVLWASCSLNELPLAGRQALENHAQTGAAILEALGVEEKTAWMVGNHHPFGGNHWFWRQLVREHPNLRVLVASEQADAVLTGDRLYQRDRPGVGPMPAQQAVETLSRGIGDPRLGESAVGMWLELFGHRRRGFPEIVIK